MAIRAVTPGMCDEDTFGQVRHVVSLPAVSGKIRASNDFVQKAENQKTSAIVLVVHILLLTSTKVFQISSCSLHYHTSFNLLKPTGHVMHQQFNIQQLYVLPTVYLRVLYLSENKQRLVPLTA